jgi:hypothetical protein
VVSSLFVTILKVIVADACEGCSVLVNKICGPDGGAADFTFLEYEAL